MINKNIACFTFIFTEMSVCRLYLSGAHSTGKTTILNDLKPYLTIRFEEEIARNVIKNLNWSRDEFLPETHPERFYELNEKILQRQIQMDERNSSFCQGK